MKLAMVSAVAALLCAGSAAAQALSTYPLPPDVRYPEGITVDPATGALYTAGTENGVLVRLDAATGRTSVVAPAWTVIPQGSTAFPGALGMKRDGMGRIWMALGRTNAMAVVDSRTGAVIKRFETKRQGGLINDAIVTPTAVYFTDTFVPVLWRVPLNGGAIGELEPWLDLAGTPIQYGADANLNGIAATPDGKTLIVVQMGKGLLFAVDTATKRVTPIDLKGEKVETADGLVLDGSTLYVVRQGAGEIVTVRLSPDLRSGTVVSRFKDPALTWPATAVKAGDELVVVDTQFNRHDANDPATPFKLVRVPLARLQGR